jgi:type VI secretion system protein ImpL
MNRLGDAIHSPLGLLMQTVYAQTSWDNPSLAKLGLERAQGGFVAWIKRSVLRMSPSRLQVELDVDGKPRDMPMGPIGAEFSGLARLLAAKDGAEPLAGVYLKQLSTVRSRLNQLNNQGDPGPGAVVLLRDTIAGGSSELSDTLRFIDEQMLATLPEAQRETLRPLLVRPLLETFAAVVKPGERELNKVWLAQVHDPFNGKLAGKYPFSASSGIEAVPVEIARIFGPEGAIAKYAEGAMGALVVRRGSTIAPRTWGDLGVHLRPEFSADFARWIAPLDGGASAAAAETASPQTVFMIMPHPAPGTTEYMIEIDGQQLRYRNGAAQWANFIWPNPGAMPGVRIQATTFDGRSVEVASFSGRFGLEKLLTAADRIRRPDGTFQLGWQAGEVSVKVDLRIVSSVQTHAQSDGSTSQGAGLGGVRLPAAVVGAPESPAPHPVTAAADPVADTAGWLLLKETG